MKKLSSSQIRTMWLQFFAENNHYILPYSSLIPVNDLSLLWINSGIANLKPYFDGRLTPPFQNLANSQKSIRTNDIAKVGLTSRHHTLFEMLGNFSIGGYFKKQALLLAWEFLTDPKWLAINKTKLFITVYKEDDTTINFWKNLLHVPKANIIHNDKNLNFWDIGAGPCGPNTEIFYDRGSDYDPQNKGLTLLQNDIENDRYIEIWNIVFSQYNHLDDASYEDLPRKNIDTGAGLERISCLSQNTVTNFETDLFYPLIQKTMLWTNAVYKADDYFNPQPKQTAINTHFKIIADHVRAVMFAIADGVYPSNKERGYVIRRLIRRAYLQGNHLGITEPFLHKLIPTCVATLVDYYDYLTAKTPIIVATILQEETLFAQTIKKGLEMFAKITNDKKELDGFIMFKLYETYGFPLELIVEEAEKRHLKYSTADFLKVKADNIAFSQKQTFFDASLQKQDPLYLQIKDDFVSTYDYNDESSEVIKNAKIKKIIVDNKLVKQVKAKECLLIFDKSPFYAEKGGQASDKGVLIHNDCVSKITKVWQLPYKQFAHLALVEDLLQVGDRVVLKVNHEKRYYTRKNHSGTHLLHAACREILGAHVMQIGSYNDEKKLRIDINHNQKITISQLEAIEKLVNEKIQAHIPCEVIHTDYETAVHKYNALAFFHEKYDEQVRIVRFSAWSCELCGGTHCANTSEIEVLKIINLESKGSNSFRITALTSTKTVNNFWNQFISKINKKVLSYKKDASSRFLKVLQEWDNLKKNPLNYWKIMFDYEKRLDNIYKQQSSVAQRKIIQKQTKQMTIEPTIILNKYSLFTAIIDYKKEIIINWIKQKQNTEKSFFLIGLITVDQLLIFLAVNKELNYTIKPFYNLLKQKFAHLQPKGGGNNNFGQIILRSAEKINLFQKIKEEYEQWIITSDLI